MWVADALIWTIVLVPSTCALLVAALWGGWLACEIDWRP